MNRHALQQMSDWDIAAADLAGLAELTEFTVDQEEPIAERLESLVCQLGNPYCFTVGATPVKLSFRGEEPELAQRILHYFSAK